MMFRTLLALPGLLLLVSAAGAAGPPQRTIDFTRDVKPILDRSCISCHGVEKQRGGLRLDNGSDALKGSNSGPVLAPGNSARSRLFIVVAGLDDETKMPPGKGKALKADEVQILRSWIDQGARWPAGDAVVAARKSDHWAFQPIRRLPAPKVGNQNWVRNPIDAFVLARLENEKITPAEEADRVTLLRRLFLDLLGLPPTPEEVDQFLADSSPNAYEKLVDRLLSSPHYGERWGRHWLDLARYADSDGYEKDSPRPFAWRYRQWVIDNLNANLPYDRFAIEQLAGDLLPGSTSEQKAATGFHRNTLTNKEGGVDQEQFRVEAVVDRVNTTAKVFLGVTLGCAQCHDHKYDLFSQREYYQFFAFFDRDVEVNVPAPLFGEVIDPQLVARLKKLEGEEKAYRGKQLPAKLTAWEKTLTPEQIKTLPAAIQAVVKIQAAKRADKQQKALADHFATLDPDLVNLTRQISDLRKKVPQVMAQALSLGGPRKTQVMIRGDFLRKGVEVSAGTPGVLPALAPSATPDRLRLANWLADPSNPLPARVAVNWVWHKYFGRGIVPTLEDFGTQGEKPSHPELLDYLASEFVRHGWDVKALHKLIVTSATYRQSSRTRPELAGRDPYNTLLARQVRLRLEAEVVRDGALSAGGILAPIIGGPSVRPTQPAGISELTYAGSAKWAESTGLDKYRRGLYTWFQRTSPYPMLMTFDAPDANLSCVRRERSNTPLQALTLLNDVPFVEAARGLGRAGLEGKADKRDRLMYVFRLCVARSPSPVELDRLERFFDDLLALAKAEHTQGARRGAKDKGEPAEAVAWTALGRALLNLDEFVTRE